MPLPTPSPPLHPDMKRELKQQLSALSARGFELFAGEFLVYVGLETVAVTRYKEFLDFAKSRNLSRSYKPVMLKAFFSLVDRDGKVSLDDLARVFRTYYIQQLERGEPLERDNSLMAHPAEASDQAVKQLIRENPLKRFQIKNFILYSADEGMLQIAPQLWQALFHYEVKDALASAEEQIHYYLARQKEENMF